MWLTLMPCGCRSGGGLNRAPIGPKRAKKKCVPTTFLKTAVTSACFSISLSAHMAQNNSVAGNYNDYCTHRSEKSYTKIAYLNLDRVGTIARSKNQEDDAF